MAAEKQIKVLFMVNIPSPYRIDFFNELGKECCLYVTFEGENATDRNENWKNTNFEHFTPIFLNGLRVNSDKFLCPGIINIIKQGWDMIFVGGYSSPTAMMAIEYMNLHHIPWSFEADGGVIKPDKNLIYKLKKHFISHSQAWFSTGNTTKEYLVHYGANPEKIHWYPFTSLKCEDFENAKSLKQNDKTYYRKKLNMIEEHIVLSVGRFSYNNGYGKGYDVLLEAAEKLPETVGVYIVGDEPTEEFTRMKREKGLDNVHFIGFKKKNELAEYYAAADMFILLSRGDVWGLVINEAMMFGLPVITTQYCVAGVELISDGENGYIVGIDNVDDISKKIMNIISNKEVYENFSQKSLNKIEKYSIEEMANVHLKYIEETVTR